MRKLLFFIVIVVGCEQSNINDFNYRNDNWAWFINVKTGKGEWLPIAEKMSVSTGFYTLFYDTGEIFEEGFIKDSVAIDTARVYDKNYNLIKLIIFEGDEARYHYITDGEYEELFRSGELRFQGSVKNNKEYGLWVEYDKGGRIIWKANYTDNGFWSSRYYGNNLVRDSAYSENNKQQGIYKQWFENGKIAQITEWKDNLQNGNQVYFYENGQLRGKEFWINGKIDGYVKHYYPNGKVKYEDYFINGERHGLRIDYYDNGKIKSEQSFINGIADGIFKWYNGNGELYQVDTYENGELIDVHVIEDNS